MSLSPLAQTILAGVAETTGRAIAEGLRASSEDAALEVVLASLKRNVEEIESARAREKFPELREG